MKYKKLGRTKLNCSIIGFGCWGLGGIAYGPVSDKTSINALNKSLDRGINFYDTSDLYGDKDDWPMIAKIHRLLIKKGYKFNINKSISYCWDLELSKKETDKLINDYKNLIKNY